MFQGSFTFATKLDKAVLASIAAMLAMNVFVLAQQLGTAPVIALAQPTAAQQA